VNALPRSFTLAAGALVALALYLGLTYLMLPCAPVNDLVAAWLTDRGMTLAPGAQKTPLPGLCWSKPVLSSEKGELLRLDRASVRIKLLPLLAGRLEVAGEGRLGGGSLTAGLGMGMGTPHGLTLEASGVKLEEIPLFRSVLGARLSGDFWSSGRFVDGPGGASGQLKLEVNGLGCSGLKLGDFPLPDLEDLRCQGGVRLNAGGARLESLSLSGPGVYLRLSGELPWGGEAARKPLDLTLEIMPKPEFQEKQKLVFLLLAKFAVAPGVYRIPIHGTLLKPTIT